MKKLRVCEMALAGVLALAVACPQVSGGPLAKAAPTLKLAAPAPAPAKAAPPIKAAQAPAAPAKAASAAAPAAAVVDPKAVEAQLLVAQGQVVAGNLDAGLKALQDVLAKAAPALTPRIGFVQKLVEIRIADRLGDQAKVSAGLSEAMKQATQPEKVNLKSGKKPII